MSDGKPEHDLAACYQADGPTEIDPQRYQSAILPCPFCGSDKMTGPHFSEYCGDHRFPTWWVECNECPCGMEVKHESVAVLIEAWNKRAGQKDLQGHAGR